MMQEMKQSRKQGKSNRGFARNQGPHDGHTQAHPGHPFKNFGSGHRPPHGHPHGHGPPHGHPHGHGPPHGHPFGHPHGPHQHHHDGKQGPHRGGKGHGGCRLPFIKVLRQACKGRGPGKGNEDVCAKAIAQVLEKITQHNDDEDADLQAAVQASILTKVQEEIDEVHKKQKKEEKSSDVKQEEASSNTSKPNVEKKEHVPERPEDKPKPEPEPKKHFQVRSRPSSVFIQDVTLPDASPTEAGAVLKKVWKVKNNGKSAWPRNSRLVCVGGDLLGTDPAGIIVPPVEPGLSVDLEVTIKVPTTAGRYVSYYRLMTDRQERFGHRLWIDIVVEKPASLAKQVGNVLNEAVNGILPYPNTPATADVVANIGAELKNQTIASGPRKYEREIRVLQTMGFNEFQNKSLYSLLEQNNGDIGKTVNNILG